MGCISFFVNVCNTGNLKGDLDVKL
jgi:hypothetical protein